MELQAGPGQVWMWNCWTRIFAWFSARGASKTYGAMLMLWRRASEWDGFKALVLRRNFAELEESVVDKFITVLKDVGDEDMWDIKQAKGGYRATNKATGSYIVFGAADTVDRARRYQGTEYHNIVMDEPQNFKPEVLGLLWALARSRVGAPRPQIYLLANPGGPSHTWLRKTFYDTALSVHPTGNVHSGDTGYWEMDWWTHPITGEDVQLKNHWQFNLDLKQLLQRDLMSGEELPEELSNLPVLPVEVVTSGTQYNPVFDYREYHASMALGLNNEMRRAWVLGDMTVQVGQFLENVPAWVSKKPLKVDDTDLIICGIDPGLRKCGVVWFAVDRMGRFKCFDAYVILNQGVETQAPMIANRYPELFHRTLFVFDIAANKRNEQTLYTTMDAFWKFGKINGIAMKSGREDGWQLMDAMGNSGKFLICPEGANLLVDSIAGLQTKENNFEDCEDWYGTVNRPDGDHLADAARYVLIWHEMKGYNDPNPRVQEWLEINRNPIARRRLFKGAAQRL